MADFPENPLSEILRRESICRGCGKPKDPVGFKPQFLIVCWDCFKGGKTPYKYWPGDFPAWLGAMGQHREAACARSEIDLVRYWDSKGVNTFRQIEILDEIKAKAQPGAMVGIFQIQA